MKLNIGAEVKGYAEKAFLQVKEGAEKAFLLAKEGAKKAFLLAKEGAKKAFIKLLSVFAAVVLYCRNCEKKFEQFCSKRNIDVEVARKVITVMVRSILFLVIIVVGIAILGWDLRELVEKIIDALS